MKTIHKYSIDPGSESIQMPQGARIKHVAGQNDRICFWVIVDPERIGELRHFKVYGTGHEISDEAYACGGGPSRMSDKEIFESYIGTALIGEFVWHVFEYLEQG